ncbi:ACP S-malonyltransferase [Pseudactinotalea sp.]|uniref:ACP S-malonyltransferase n=1 Tax=Pseudactinotalea sp. TaxID=1926260 RepID=UPI003B3B2480
MIAVLCPGQGSQTPGMLTPWLDRDDLDARGVLERLSEAAQVDLLHLGTEADADAIKDTAVAQPLIVATSLLSLTALTATAGSHTPWTAVTAGHSVGEYAAAVVAGVLTDTEALSLVATRGRAMAAAAAATPTGMAAVVGGDPDEVLDAIRSHDLVAANVNGGGQVVAAGSREAIAALQEAAPARARVIPLAVAGAFHTDYMRSAVDAVSDAASALAPAAPSVPLLTNADGSVVPDGPTALRQMVAQISRPVRWDLCQEQLAALGVTAAIELAPAGVLTGLAKRTLKGVEVVALKSPDDLDAVADLVDRHRARP